MAGTVLVTGASGYLALHIISQLLDKGYRVVGSVRSQDKADKLSRNFKSQIGSKADNLCFSLVADIAEPNAFDQTFKAYPEIEAVIHTASPFTMGYADFEKAYYTPAINGTEGVLKSIKAHGLKVRKVIVTSSFASIMNATRLHDPTFIHTEEVWNPMTKKDATHDEFAYCVSKKLAEEAAWNFVKNNDVNFTMTTVCPPMIIGPQVFDEDASGSLNQSNQVFTKILDTKPGEKFVNDVRLLSSDARDVAAFHIIPLERSNVEGHRLFPASNLYSEQEVLNIVLEKFPQLKGQVSEGEQEDTAVSIGFSNEKTRELVGGYDFLPLEKQVVDGFQQVLKARGISL